EAELLPKIDLFLSGVLLLTFGRRESRQCQRERQRQNRRRRKPRYPQLHKRLSDSDGLDANPPHLLSSSFFLQGLLQAVGRLSNGGAPRKFSNSQRKPFS